MAKRIRPGDVLEVAGPGGGHLYLHYLGKQSEYGEAVSVCPVEHKTRPSSYEGLFSAGYVAFYPATAAVSRGLAHAVGHIASGGVPTRLRRPGARTGTIVRSWIVEDGASESVKLQLSGEDLRLPIAVIWNHELLLQRVRDGWRPEMEGP